MYLNKALENHGIVIGLVHLKHDRIMIVYHHTQKPHCNRSK